MKLFFSYIIVVCVACSELEITKERIKKILDAGANVVMTSKGIDDMYMKYFVEAGCVAVRRVEKADLRRLAKATGGAYCHYLSLSFLSLFLFCLRE